MALSLDGTEEIHNYIRNDKYSYKNVVNTLSELEKYSNMDLLIETAIMNQNKHLLNEIKDLLNTRFKNIDHQIFMARPVDSTDFAINKQEFYTYREICEEMFDGYISSSRSRFLSKKKHRCLGGIEHAVISGDGIVRICPIAVEEEFVLGNLKDNNLNEIWRNPKGNIPYYRKEYEHETIQCKKCHNRNKCGSKNYRIEALRLTGNSKNANPITCYIVNNFS